MKICLVGDFKKPRDMGERNLAYNLAKVLSLSNSVMTLRPKDILDSKSIIRLREYGPDVMHYLTGPRTRSFIVLSILKWIARCRITVMSAPRPVIPDTHLRFLKFIKPDMVLSQSTEHLKIFLNYGFNAKFLPNGVDMGKFRPVDENHKKALREKYNVPQNRYVVLHTGYISKRRGIEALVRLAQERDLFIIVVGATSWINPDISLVDRLNKVGCRVILKYLPTIEELYQLSDSYVFPGRGATTGKKSQFQGRNQSPSIEIPLSVLEALACNLPAVSRKFGGLEEMFPRNSGIFFADSDQQILDTIKALKSSSVQQNSYQLIENYTWEKIAGRIEHIYTRLLDTRNR